MLDLDSFRKLTAVSLVPFAVSVILFFIYQSDKYKNASTYKKQIFAGLVFGCVAIFATEMGVPVGEYGAVVNIRAAAPLCAGFIFGPWAGIIAGVIGGVERWFSVYWTNAYYTRLACSLSTVLAGMIAAYLRHYVFEEKVPYWRLGMYAGFFCETVDMLLIFYFSYGDVRESFSFVRACAVPMLLVNGLTVGFTCLIIERIIRESGDSAAFASISTQYQRSLIRVVMAGFLFTAGFTYFIESQISVNDTFELMVLNMLDAYDDLVNQVDMNQLSKSRSVAEDYFYDLNGQPIEMVAAHNEVSDVIITDKDGWVITATDPDLIGANLIRDVRFYTSMRKLMNSQRVSGLEFEQGNDESYRRYAARSFEDSYVLTAYNKQQFYGELESRFDNLINNRRIGEWGFLVVADKEGTIVADMMGYVGKNVDDLGLKRGVDEYSSDYTRYQVEIDSVDYYYMYSQYDYFTLYAFMLKSEADFPLLISTYMNIFMEIIVFGFLFVIIYYTTKSRIVNNIDTVNESLAQITKGNLETVVDVRDNQEFTSLSDGINTTVDSMKLLIREANERIDSELQYAKEIQTSTLPTRFPAFPEYADHFDIYALMDPAKEVGGDFYDFYMINDHTITFLVADVSGKGIPASLFMMRAKTMIKTDAEAGLLPGEILANANDQLCEGNDAGMFVTAWIGFLDLRNGELRYANAGHNPPLLKRNGGVYEYLSMPAGFVLAGVEKVTYKEQTLMLEPGDEIFIYTDGVVEATSIDNELYGEDRLYVCLNSLTEKDSEGICKEVRNSVEAFYEGAPQFDDITELSLIFKAYIKE